MDKEYFFQPSRVGIQCRISQFCVLHEVSSVTYSLRRSTTKKKLSMFRDLHVSHTDLMYFDEDLHEYIS